MSLASSLAELRASLDQGNEEFTNKHFRLIIEALESLVDGTGVRVTGFLTLPSPELLTIAGGIVTATQSYHNLDTEGGAPADDVDTINGGASGSMLVLKSTDSSRDVTLKDSTGNMRLASDCILDNVQDMVLLVRSGSVWQEVARSQN